MDRYTSTGTRASLRNRFFDSDPIDGNDPMVFDWHAGKVDLGASRVQNGSLQLCAFLPLDDFLPFHMVCGNTIYKDNSRFVADFDTLGRLRIY